MGYPYSGEKATITSIDSSDASQLLIMATRQVELALNFETSSDDVTPLSGTVVSTEMLAGLRTGTFSFQGRYLRSAPRIGNSGNITFATSGYVVHPNAWNLDIDFGEQEITSFTGSAVTDRVWRPAGVVTWSGSFTSRATSDAAMAMPYAPNGTAAAFTFKLTEDAAADPSFTGSGIITGKSMGPINARSIVPVTYTFAGSGDLTAVAGTNFPALLPAGVVGTADWDDNADGTPDIEAVVTAFTGRTYTGPIFLRSVSISCEIGGPINVSGVCRWAGAVTTA